MQPAPSSVPRDRFDPEIYLRTQRTEKSVEAGGAVRLAGKTLVGTTVRESHVAFDAIEALLAAGLRLNRQVTTRTVSLRQAVTRLTTVALVSDVEQGSFRSHTGSQRELDARSRGCRIEARRRDLRQRLPRLSLARFAKPRGSTGTRGSRIARSELCPRGFHQMVRAGATRRGALLQAGGTLCHLDPRQRFVNQANKYRVGHFSNDQPRVARLHQHWSSTASGRRSAPPAPPAPLSTRSRSTPSKRHVWSEIRRKLGLTSRLLPLRYTSHRPPVQTAAGRWLNRVPILMFGQSFDAHESDHRTDSIDDHRRNGCGCKAGVDPRVCLGAGRF